MNSSILVLKVLLACTPASVQAQDYIAQIKSQLTAQGFVGIEVERTLLGRMQITGEANGGERESS